MTIGSSSARAAAVVAVAPASEAVVAAAVPGSVSSEARSMCAARARGVGWSKTKVEGRRRPVAALSRLRSSTAARESKPISLKARVGSTAVASSWPRTAATRSRTSSSTCPSRSGSGRASRACANGSSSLGPPGRDPAADPEPTACPAGSADPIDRADVADRVGRAGRTTDRSRGGMPSGRARTAAASTRTVRATGVPDAAQARSNRARLSAGVSGASPWRSMRRRAVEPRVVPMPSPPAHRLHTWDCAVRPRARR